MKKSEEENQYKNIIEQIADILGLGVPRVSNNSLQMCCPFHKESNPSFGISMKTGEYNCFACGAKGHISKLSNNLRVHIVAEKIEDIDNFKVSTKVDTTKKYTAKPNKTEVKSIQFRLRVRENIMKFKICDLITLIIRGHTVCVSGNNRNDDWEMQQLWMLDFDNKETNYTMEDVLNYAKSINLIPTFAYYSFSNTKKTPKFRFVYCFKEPITSQKRMQAIVDNLLKLFENYSVDKSRRNLSSLFFGTKFDDDVFTSNYIYSIRFTDEQLADVGKLVYGNSHSVTRTDEKENIIDDIEDVSKYFDKSKFKHEIFAQDLISEYNFITLNTLPHFYKNGLYINNSKRDIERLIKSKIPSLSSYYVNEVLTDLALLSVEKQECDYHILAFKNGLLDIETLKFIEFTPDVILTSGIAVDYIKLDVENCHNVVVDKFFSDITRWR